MPSLQSRVSVQPQIAHPPTARSEGPDRRTVIRLLSRLRTAEGQSNPFPIYAELRALGDVVPAPWGAFLVTGFKSSDHVLRGTTWGALDAEWREAQSNSIRWTGPAARDLAKKITALNPPLHTRQRRALGNVFDRERLAGLRPRIRRIAGKLVDEFLAVARRDGSADFAELVSDRLPALTLAEWLGVPARDLETLRALTYRYSFVQELLPTDRQLAVAGEAAEGLVDYFDRLVARRRRRPGNDLVSTWLRTWDQLEPANRELADETVSYLANFAAIASLETTAMLASNTVRLVMGHPDQLALLQADPGRVPDAVEEVLRYDPSVHVISRVAQEDAILSGVRIAKGQLVHALTASATHDPDETSEPDTFDITRRGRTLAFGGGIHYCVGAALARLEAACVLEALLDRGVPVRLDGEDAVAWQPSLVFRRVAHLRLAWNPGPGA